MDTLRQSVPRTRPAQRSGITLGRVFFMLVAMLGATGAATAAHADDGAIRPDAYDDAYAAQAESTSWVPQEIEQGYVLDPGFAGGRFKAIGLNALGAPNPNADFAGRATALLSNGDTVVVGLTPPFGENNQGNGLWNLGMVRFGPDGAQKLWPNPGSYGNGWDVTVIYPGAASSRIQYVRDVKVWNGFIYVLADYQTEAAGLGRQDVYTYIFREDGSYVAQLRAFGGGISSDPNDFYGAQLVPVNADRMMIVATTWDNLGPYVAVNRQIIQHGGGAEGTLAWDTSWGNPYGGNNLDRIKPYFVPDNFCTASVSTCNAIVEYATKATGFDFDDIYLAGSVQYDGADAWDAYVLKISTQDGNPKPEFSSDGWRPVWFDEEGSGEDDRARGLYVYQDDVYLALAVDRACHPGIGMAKLDGASGNYVAAFGNSGQIVFGGQGSAPLCFGGVENDVPFAMDATPNRLGIVGYHASNPGIGGSTRYDPMLAVVQADNGTVLDLDSHPVIGDAGIRIGDAVLYDVFGGNGVSFTAAGDARYASAGNRTNFLSGRFVPVSSDRIFASSFGTTLAD